MKLPLNWRLAPLLFCLFSLLCTAGCRTESKHQAVKIGFMICNNEKETLQRFTPLTRYLSEKTGADFTLVPVDTQDFEKRFKSGEFAFTHTNSLLYIILKERYSLSLLASEKRGQYGSRTAGAIIARAGSGITKLSDIRGKRMGFGPMLAPTGYLAEYDLMLRSGIDPEKNLAYYSIPSGSFKHEKVIYGVLFGQYDVAAAPALDLEEMTREGRISPDSFVVLGQSPIIPYCTFGASKGTDPDLVAKVRKALLELKPSDTVKVDGEEVKVLKGAWVDGYEELLDSDYNPIRDMARRVNMPPYQKF
ncbi:phosphate/phosphite/phosphonate ABC transporter substrate-binding protein [Geomonas sp. RF6]|uniref:phosphate/phosphite/phosphonate ABC transporter substrate-binding protein n=1 Tax=Geomonas sp. RF6 TaxID=2897342 RepID=UPI001E4CCE63|nr:phosphate/phosphite/phosphonate ABC transporter substrate-binding protein [Geomonas sp. RF6]UFS70311.1 phosphate/phosphite/phosphonate ABC transporter substrate-binding protein [Geomonas sp. RF6]